MTKIILLVAENLDLVEVLANATNSVIGEGYEVQTVCRDYQAEPFLQSDDLVSVIFTGKTKTRDENGQSVGIFYGKNEIKSKLKNQDIPLIKATNWLGKVSASKIKKELIKLNFN